MGNACTSLGTKEEHRASDQIDSALKETRKAILYETKILLLGTGESGKSTILKQLRIIYKNGFPEDELLTYVPIIHGNIISSMATLARNMLANGMFDSCPEEIKEHASFISKPDVASQTMCNSEITQAVRELWASPVVKTRWENKSDLQIIDAAAYFFDNLDRITKENYIPTQDDVIQSRVRTVGISEISFKLAGAALRIVDVGGQRSERRKWIHCFEDVTVIFFIVAISEYDQVLREDESTNRLFEALNLFSEIANCEWFAKTPLILFLNKKDLFEVKLKKVPLSNFFSDWTGGADLDKATGHIQAKFLEHNHDPARRVYVHVTCATNTDNARFVFKAFQDIFLSARLQNTGLAM